MKDYPAYFPVSITIALRVCFLFTDANTISLQVTAINGPFNAYHCRIYVFESRIPISFTISENMLLAYS
jgi:hypothetical protein